MKTEKHVDVLFLQDYGWSEWPAGECEPSKAGTVEQVPADIAEALVAQGVASIVPGTETWV